MTNNTPLNLLIDLLIKYDIQMVVYSKNVIGCLAYEKLRETKRFTFYEVVDGRSAGYIATGLSVEIEKPVILVCKEGADFRSLMPALTEAYYRAIPIVTLVINDSGAIIDKGYIGFYDTSKHYKDICVKQLSLSESIIIKNAVYANIAINETLQNLYWQGGGPIIIQISNLDSVYFDCEDNYEAFVIPRLDIDSSFPILNKGEIYVALGDDAKLSSKEIGLLNTFLMDYSGKMYPSNMNSSSEHSTYIISDDSTKEAKLLIIIGGLLPCEIKETLYNAVWYVDDNCRDYPLVNNLRYCFEMSPSVFLGHYCNNTIIGNKSVNGCHIQKAVDNLQFTRETIALELCRISSEQDVIYVGYNSNLKYFKNIFCAAELRSNSGALGKDGLISRALGASIIKKNNGRVFVVVDEDEFLHDMNALCNRHFQGGIIIMLLLDSNSQYSWAAYVKDCNLKSIEINDLTMLNAIDMQEESQVLIVENIC